MTDKDKISNGRGVKAVSQGTGRRYEIDVGRASEGGVDMGLSWPADTDECVVQLVRTKQVEPQGAGNEKISSKRVSRCEDRVGISVSGKYTTGQISISQAKG